MQHRLADPLGRGHGQHIHRGEPRHHAQWPRSNAKLRASCRQLLGCVLWGVLRSPRHLALTAHAPGVARRAVAVARPPWQALGRAGRAANCWARTAARFPPQVLVRDTQTLLEFANGTGSLSFYMVGAKGLGVAVPAPAWHGGLCAAVLAGWRVWHREAWGVAAAVPGARHPARCQIGAQAAPACLACVAPKSGQSAAAVLRGPFLIVCLPLPRLLRQIHGGTNFGFWAGAGLDGDKYVAHITRQVCGCRVMERTQPGGPRWLPPVQWRSAP